MKPSDLLAIRLEYGLSQSAFAEALGLSLRTIQRYETGKHRIKLSENQVRVRLLEQTLGSLRANRLG